MQANSSVATRPSTADRPLLRQPGPGTAQLGPAAVLERIARLLRLLLNRRRCMDTEQSTTS
jgi:hypothetical protein